MLEAIRYEVSCLLACGDENDATLRTARPEAVAADIMAYSDYFWEIAPASFQALASMDEQRMILGNLIASLRGQEAGHAPAS